ncbi:hypothetical protein [Streptomyces xiaopingdaonensis]|uniref:hypothetical protein n=1 Tax=Streptomyces xiaopingdaonensis TaxID=1565415 RepID=UPI00031CEBF3|nr:hypothetical protein [Streptomyces xiaopingdaonensis]
MQGAACLVVGREELGSPLCGRGRRLGIDLSHPHLFFTAQTAPHARDRLSTAGLPHLAA